MIEISILGELRVEAPLSSHASDVYTRPKPVALLLFLALSQPRGFHSADTLLALFWPESEISKAQTSLRQAVHQLRRALGDSCLIRRGRTELGISFSEIFCDAICFDDAVAANDHERALSLYDGELLPGFHVADAPDFERWLSAERSRRHDQAVWCARELIKFHRAHGNHQLAERTARRWLSFDGRNESALLSFMQQSAQIGQIDDALRAYDWFVAAQQHDGLRVSDRIVELADHIRKSVQGVPIDEVPSNTTHTQSIEANGTQNIITPAPPLTDFAAQRNDAREFQINGSRNVRHWFSLRRGTGAALVAMAASVVMFVISHIDLKTPANTRNAQHNIAIMPFVIRGSTSLSYLREGMVDLLSAKLDGVGEIRVIAPATVLASALSDSAALKHPGRYAAEMRKMGATQYVIGTIVQAEQHIAITAAIYDLSGVRRATIERDVQHDADLLPSVDSLARDILATQFTNQPDHLEHAAVTTTNSLAAVRAFLEGERDVRQGQTNAAVDAFTRAVAEDSTFALAHYRLSTTALWSANADLVRRSIEQSMRFASRLPRHERLALEARNLTKNGAAEQAERAYKNIVAQYPDDVEAWNQLGELQFHTGPWRGHPIGEARAAFENVARRQPAEVNALVHLARLATLEKRRSEVSSLVEQALRLSPEEVVRLELLALQATASGTVLHQRSSSVGSSGVSQSEISPDEQNLLIWRVATYGDNPEQAESIAKFFGSPLLAANSTDAELATSAHMLAAAGQWKGAELQLDALDRRNTQLAQEVRANLAMSWPGVLTAAQRTGVVSSPMSTIEDSMRQGERADTAVLTAIVHRAYLRGALALTNGDTMTAHQVSRALLRISELHANEFARHLAFQLRARLAWQRGDARTALGEVEHGWPQGSPRAALPLFQGAEYTQAHERFFRAQLLASLARNDEARQWFNSVVDDQGASVVLSVPVHIALAHLAERRGDPSEALAQYQQAADLWSHADAELAPQISALNERIKLLHVALKSEHRHRLTD